MLADEPTGALNQEVAQEVLELFVRVIEEYGSTVIIVTHDPLVNEYVDSTVNLIDGEIKP